MQGQIATLSRSKLRSSPDSLRDGTVHGLSCGSHTRWSGAVTGLAVLVFLPFADFLSSLPAAVLGAIVIGAVLGLIRLLPILRLARIAKPQFLVASTTFVLTLARALHIEWAVIVGAISS